MIYRRLSAAVSVSQEGRHYRALHLALAQPVPSGLLPSSLATGALPHNGRRDP